MFTRSLFPLIPIVMLRNTNYSWNTLYLTTSQLEHSNDVTRRSNASAVLEVVILFVCPSHACSVTKRKNVGLLLIF